MAQTIAVTGASGFVGHAVALEVLARGHRLIAIARRAYTPSWGDKANARLIVSDSLGRVELRRELKDEAPAAFVHCAWQGVAGKDRNQTWQLSDNLRMTIDALELAGDAGCGYWLSLGSQAEYGNQNRRMNEDAPTNPTTLYGKAKLLAHEIAHAFCGAAGMTSATLRIFSTYGPGDAPHWLIPYVIRELMSDRSPNLTACEQKWDYLHVADAARGIVSATEKQAAGVFNLGSGQTYVLREVIERIRQELRTPATVNYGAVAYRPDQVMHLEADITRLTQATGWHPTVRIEDGIRDVVAFEKAAKSTPHHE